MFAGRLHVAAGAGRVGRLVDELRLGTGSLGHAFTAAARAATGRNDYVEGLGTLLERFYSAVRGEGPPPVTLDEMDAANALLFDLFEEDNRAVRALVTGAGGFLGRRLVERLLADGDEVYAVVRPSREPPPELAAATLIRADLRVPGALPAESLAGVERRLSPGRVPAAPVALDVRDERHGHRAPARLARRRRLARPPGPGQHVRGVRAQPAAARCRRRRDDAGGGRSWAPRRLRLDEGAPGAAGPLGGRNRRLRAGRGEAGSGLRSRTRVAAPGRPRACRTAPS